MTPLNAARVAIRHTMCQGCDCAVDYADPCAECPRRAWRRDRSCPGAQRPPPPSTPPPAPIVHRTGEEPELPSLASRVVSYGTAVVRDTLAGRPRRTPEEQAAILAICRECPAFRHSDETCSRCGCPIAQKSPLGREHCPVGKW